jgi:hypothetical protein
MLSGKLLVRRRHRHPCSICGSLADAHSSTKPHKAVPTRAHRAEERLNNADHSARARSHVPGKLQGGENVPGVKEMTICDVIHSGRCPGLSRKMRIALFFLAEGVAALLIGFAALFLSFEPVWSSS